MLFSSALFVFLFLPLVLALYHGLHARLRNAFLLLASLVFYAWGEPVVALVMLASVAMNYGFGLAVERARGQGRGRGVLALAIAANLSLLVVFKYADWLWALLGQALSASGLVAAAPAPLGAQLDPGGWLAQAFLDPDRSIRLPIGISFFTFQAASYVIDVWRREGPAQRNPLDIALYIALFPQLIAGPIVRYRDIAAQIVQRSTPLGLFASGVRRFVIGLGKKVLIANVCGEAADRVFAIPDLQQTPASAWLGLVCYSLQIYFDFSGYSCMAIGLGRMFGFRLLENFEHPYVSRSVTEFWRRWHISLSTWFRDYLYIPLGGNRGSRARTGANLLIVFLLCGLWHGAAATFVVWGLYHGAFLVLERAGLGRLLAARGAGLRHLYVLAVVMVGWVFFRSTSFAQAWHLLQALCGVQDGSQVIDLGPVSCTAAQLHPLALHANPLTWAAIVAGVVGSTPWLPRLRDWHAGLEAAGRTRLSALLDGAALLGLALILTCVAMELAGGAYNPFIYFRF